MISLYNCVEHIDLTEELKIEFMYVYFMIFQNNLSRYENNCDDEVVRREFDAYFRIFVNWLCRELNEKQCRSIISCANLFSDISTVASGIAYYESEIVR